MVGEGVWVGVWEGRGVLEAVGEGPAVLVCGGTAVSVTSGVASSRAASEPPTTSVAMFVGLGSSATAVTTIVGKGVGAAEAQPTRNKVAPIKMKEMTCDNLIDMTLQIGE